MSVSTLKSNGKSIILVDCSNLNLTKKSEIISTLESGSSQIAKSGPKSALVITNVTNTGFDGSINDAFKSYASRNTPYVKASAIVGLSGLQKVMFSAIKALTKREFYISDSINDAIAFLTKQKQSVIM